ncbi:hypothetical protein BCY91_13960 [Pelobium manganitolerans]|uniref:HTH cro/C1-type domain-containing protein n=1 Tax=Pelobium manganitolerans TaxID=1842495 RepID=A0A419S9V3_9SPHI|nr:helix-turn-helix transcriptional regulator [Pelobium manganitolerans]RKD18977.1 hypothetical protein BCY91_13960 [Pelobium manganitolerans]
MKPNELLKHIMEAEGITQDILAEQAGISQPTIHRMIKGTQNLNWKVLMVLRSVYKADINKFFDGQNWTKNRQKAK